MESELKKSTNGHRTNGTRIYNTETGDKRSSFYNEVHNNTVTGSRMYIPSTSQVKSHKL